MGSGVRRIVPLTLGWEDLPLSVSIHGASSADMLREPVPGVPQGRPWRPRCRFETSL